MNMGRQIIERDKLLNKKEVQSEFISKYFASEYVNIYKYHYYKFNIMKLNRNNGANNILLEFLANDKLKLIDLLYCISENNDSIATIIDDSYNDQLSILNIYKKKNSFEKFFSNGEMGELTFSLPLNALKDYFSSHRSVVFRMLDGRFVRYGEGALPPDLLENFDHYALMYNHTPTSSPEKVTKTEIEKTILNCPRCNQKCRVVKGKMIEITCPSCTLRWTALT